MRIQSLNKVSQMYSNNATNRVAKSNKVAAKDTVEISKQAKELQVAKNAVKQSPDIRQEKVEAIKRQMATGTYDVSNKEVASKIVDSIFDTRI